MNSKIAVFAVVMILVVVSVGAAFTVMQNNDQNDNIKPTGRLVVYGNSNNDDYLDERDLTMIKSIVSGDAEWDKEINPFADVNVDGKVNSDDVSHLEKILKKEKCKMYYLDVWGETSTVHYPITGSIGTMYWEQADLAILLGIWNRVTACGSVSLTEDKNPGWTSKFSLGRGYNTEPETVLSSGVSAVIAYTASDGSAHDLKKFMEGSGAEVDILAPPNADKLMSVITCGVLLSCEEKAQKYVNKCDEVMEYAMEKLSKYTPGNSPSLMPFIIYVTSTPGELPVLGSGSTGAPNGLFSYLSKTPSKLVLPNNSQTYYTTVTAEWVDSQNPDYIVIAASGVYAADLNDKGVQEAFESMCERLFGGTEAYKNGRIIATANGTMGSYFAGFAFLSLIAPLFDEIDKAYAKQVWDSWVGDGYAYYTFDQMPSYKIRVLADA